ncbi:MAG: hypothetical protein HYZ65_13265 [Burkholderiales bacterium]|nr:hypothetical protein [Burkholderiales bacterium]
MNQLHKIRFLLRRAISLTTSGCLDALDVLQTMSRLAICGIKRVARCQGNAEKMLALLERCIRFGHR